MPSFAERVFDTLANLKRGTQHAGARGSAGRHGRCRSRLQASRSALSEIVISCASVSSEMTQTKRALNDGERRSAFTTSPTQQGKSWMKGPLLQKSIRWRKCQISLSSIQL